MPPRKLLQQIKRAITAHHSETWIACVIAMWWHKHTTCMTSVGQIFWHPLTRFVNVSSQSCTYPIEKRQNGKSDENLLGVLLQTSPLPNKWIKRKAALLSPLPLSVWWTLVSDESLSWPYSAGLHVMLSHRSLPQSSHRKSVFPGHHMPSISTAMHWGQTAVWSREDCEFRQRLSNV